MMTLPKITAQLPFNRGQAGLSNRMQAVGQPIMGSSRIEGRRFTKTYHRSTNGLEALLTVPLDSCITYRGRLGTTLTQVKNLTEGDGEAPKGSLPNCLQSLAGQPLGSIIRASKGKTTC